MENKQEITLFRVFMHENIEKYIIPVLKSGMITQGPKVDEFEQKLQAYFNYPYILTLNSATSGLKLAYKLLDLNPETDYVLTTSLTCFANVCAIRDNNLKIIWCDTDPETCNVDIEDIKKKITRHTKVLSFVHWGGTPVDLDKIEEVKQFARDKFDIELKVIEDCAHAFGAEFKTRKLGTAYGNIALYSFQAIKHVSSGDGGIIVLPNKEMYDRAQLLRWYGISRERKNLSNIDHRIESDILETGYKMHMNDIAATIGLANLEGIDERIEIYRDNAKYYEEELNNLPGVELLIPDKNSKSSYWIYTLKILHGEKNNFINFMKENKVMVSQVHARNDTKSCISQFKTTLPNLDILEKQIICIPVGFWITKEDREYIVNCIKEFSASLQLQISKLEMKDLDEYCDLMFQLNKYEGQNGYLNEETAKNVYVLKHNGKMIASCKLLLEEKLYDVMGHIEDVVVHSEYRHKGYGQSLVKHVIDIGINNFDCYKVVLNCKSELGSFYEKCGLKQTGISFAKYR